MRQHPESAEASTSRDPSGERVFPILLHVLLFVSGGLALVYEVLWLRRFMSQENSTELRGAWNMIAHKLTVKKSATNGCANCLRFISHRMKPENQLLPDDYGKLLAEIKDRVRAAPV